MATELCVARGEGSQLIDLEGRKVIDFATGIGVMDLGHGHPEVIQAAQAQLELLQHTCIHIATYEPYVALCERLATLLPHGDATKVLLLNSGAEAVENAVKIARQATGRPAIICFTEAFHGRTLLGMSLTSKAGYKRGCGPFAPSIYRLPYPNHFRYGDGLDEATFVARELWRLREAFVNTVPAEHVAAIVIEAVQGEGGMVPCPAAYLRGLREVCDEHGIMLVIDEVQAGLCRTGAWASYSHAGVVPDLSTWAKALGGGLPLSAVVGRAAVMDGALPGTVGSTFGGNPVACAAALATLRVMERDDMNARALAIGARIRRRLDALAERVPRIADVRGVGAMMAMELCHGRDPRQPDQPSAKAIVSACVADGLLVIAAGAHGNAIRFLPALTISDAELDAGLDIVERHTLANA